MTRVLLAGLVVLSLVSLAAAPKPSEGERRMNLMLALPMPLRFDGDRLADIERYFDAAVGVSVAFDWSALETYGVTPESPVTLVAPGIPGGTALQWTLYAAIAQTTDSPKPIEDYAIQAKWETDHILVTLAPASREPTQTHMIQPGPAISGAEADRILTATKPGMTSEQVAAITGSDTLTDLVDVEGSQLNVAYRVEGGRILVMIYARNGEQWMLERAFIAYNATLNRLPWPLEPSEMHPDEAK